MYFEILDRLSKNQYTKDELKVLEKELRKKLSLEAGGQKEKKSVGQAQHA